MDELLPDLEDLPVWMNRWQSTEDGFYRTRAKVFSTETGFQGQLAVYCNGVSAIVRWIGTPYFRLGDAKEAVLDAEYRWHIEYHQASKGVA